VSDPVNHPEHYTKGSIECIDAIAAALGPDGFASYCTGNALKYIWRWRHKAGVQDIDKAIWYLNALRHRST
jgi:hypothetical protein